MNPRTDAATLKQRHENTTKALRRLLRPAIEEALDANFGLYHLKELVEKEYETAFRTQVQPALRIIVCGLRRKGRRR